MQTGDPNSDDELLLMSEVESLQLQLKKNGETLNEKFENIFLQSLLDKPLPDRIRKWTNRRDYLRKMAQHTSSGGPAVSLDVDSTGLKADQHVVKEEKKEQNERVKRKRIAGGEARQRKRKSVKARYSYKTNPNGRPPEMSQIHVDFAHMSVAYIRRNIGASQKDLIEHFNSSPHAQQDYHRVTTGTIGHGMANNFFVNGYFRITDLRLMAAGTLPMPVPLEQDSDGREYQSDQVSSNSSFELQHTL